MNGRNPACALAGAQLRRRRQNQLGVDDDVLLVLQFAIEIGQKLHVPMRVGVLEGRLDASKERTDRFSQPAAAVVPLELLVKRPKGLRLQARENAFERSYSDGRHVDGVPARRDRRVPKLFEVVRMFSTVASIRSPAGLRVRGIVITWKGLISLGGWRSVGRNPKVSRTSRSAVKVRFDRFALDTEARQLTRDRQTVHLSPKAFDLLGDARRTRPAVVDKAALRHTAVARGARGGGGADQPRDRNPAGPGRQQGFDADYQDRPRRGICVWGGCG